MSWPPTALPRCSTTGGKRQRAAHPRRRHRPAPQSPPQGRSRALQSGVVWGHRLGARCSEAHCAKWKVGQRSYPSRKIVRHSACLLGFEPPRKSPPPKGVASRLHTPLPPPPLLAPPPPSSHTARPHPSSPCRTGVIPSPWLTRQRALLAPLRLLLVRRLLPGLLLGLHPRLKRLYTRIEGEFEPADQTRLLPAGSRHGTPEQSRAEQSTTQPLDDWHLLAGSVAQISRLQHSMTEHSTAQRAGRTSCVIGVLASTLARSSSIASSTLTR